MFIVLSLDVFLNDTSWDLTVLVLTQPLSTLACCLEFHCMDIACVPPAIDCYVGGFQSLPVTNDTEPTLLLAPVHSGAKVSPDTQKETPWVIGCFQCARHC